MNLEIFFEWCLPYIFTLTLEKQHEKSAFIAQFFKWRRHRYCYSTWLKRLFIKPGNRMRGMREILTRIPENLLEVSGECYHSKVPGKYLGRFQGKFLGIFKKFQENVQILRNIQENVREGYEEFSKKFWGKFKNILRNFWKDSGKYSIRFQGMLK